MAHETASPGGHSGELQAKAQQLAAELASVLADALAGIAVYPEHASDPARTEVARGQALVLVNRVDVDTMNQARPVLSRWGKRLGIEPILATPAEVLASGDVFPVEFLNIQADHAYAGESDPFTEMTIPEPALQRQVEEDLRSKGLWLRGAFLREGDRPRAVRDMLVAHYAGLAKLFRSLLHLKGHPLPPGESAALDAVAAAYEVDGATLQQVASLPPKSGKSAELETLFQRYLDAVERLVEAVDAMRPE